MILNTVKKYLSTYRAVKDSGQLEKETGLPGSTCRYVWGNPKHGVSDRVTDILCKRYSCQVADLKRYVADDL